MNENLTEVVFILDRSGSMSGLEKDVIGGFNSTIKRQKGEKGECLVSTVLFNSESKVVHDRLPIKEIKNMKDGDYIPSGSTALIDALGDSIKYISKVHKIIRKEDVPKHTIFIITTDGQENSSHKYSSDEVKKMIVARQEEGWEFIYLASNIDAVETSKIYGFKVENSHSYINDELGNKKVFQCVSDYVSNTRINVCNVGTFESLDKDYQKRK